MLNPKTTGYEIVCDIPGCDTVVHLPALQLSGNGEFMQIRDVNAIVRGKAEALGWFLEIIEHKISLRALKRDICPKHANAYRTMLAARNNKPTVKEGN